MKVLLTGATGFVGSGVVNELNCNDIPFVATVRNPSKKVEGASKVYPIDGMDGDTEWTEVLKDISVVIHLAARVHIMNDDSEDPLEEFRKVNTYATLNLAKQAAESGVKRFVFLSSIKVNGEMTDAEQSFSPDDSFVPDDSYGLSKYEAEQGLLEIAKDSEMDVVIIRPPLVYGPGVKANFEAMLKWVYKGVPLPLGSIQNQRSLVAIDNLVNFIVYCSDYKKTPKAANQVFLISDNEDVSTSQLLKKVGRAFNKRYLLLPFPMPIMSFFARLLGKQDVVTRLFGSLKVDSSKASELLGWTPVTTMDQQLKKTVNDYLERLDD